METGAGAAAKNVTLFGGTNHEPPIAFPKPAPPTNHDARQNYQPPPKNNLSSVPVLQEAKQFFASMRLFENLTAAAHREAMKFFNHYTAIGWKLGGLNPIVDWHAAAKKMDTEYADGCNIGASGNEATQGGRNNPGQGLFGTVVGDGRQTTEQNNAADS